MQEQKEEKKNANLSVHQVVSEYVHKQKWDTLVGKAFHMGSEESREDFINFLTKHIDGVITTGQKMQRQTEKRKRSSV